MKKLRGIFTVAVTPFNEDGSFNIEAAKNNVDYLIDKGIHGLCILGATGEYLSITMDEHKEFAEIMLKYINKRVPVIIGATRERPDDVIELANHAKQYGADSVMVLPPYYSKPGQEEIYNHYKYISDSVDIALTVYNNPGSCGVDIEHETLKRIAKLKNAKVIKESTGDIKRLTAISMDLGDEITPFCGCDNMCYESFVMGAQGFVCMLGNIAPGMCVDMFNAIVEEKDYKKGYEIYRKALPVLNHLESFPKVVQLIKYLIEKQGRVGGYIRRPRLELTEEEKQFIDENIDISQLY